MNLRSVDHIVVPFYDKLSFSFTMAAGPQKKFVFRNQNDRDEMVAYIKANPFLETCRLAFRENAAIRQANLKLGRDKQDERPVFERDWTDCLAY